MALLGTAPGSDPVGSGPKRPRSASLGPAWLGWLAGLLFTALLLAEVPPAAPLTSEYQLKAVFLYNFAQFVEWPDAAFTSPGAPLVIGVFGPDPFGPYLDGVVQGEKIGGRPLVVRRCTRLQDIAGCHILFVTDAERLPQVLAAVAGRPVLTVGDSEHFNREGGIVRFTVTEGRIRLLINLDSAKAVHLVISSKILRPARIVAPGKD